MLQSQCEGISRPRIRYMPVGACMRCSSHECPQLTSKPLHSMTPSVLLPLHACTHIQTHILMLANMHARIHVQTYRQTDIHTLIPFARLGKLARRSELAFRSVSQVEQAIPPVRWGTIFLGLVCGWGGGACFRQAADGAHEGGVFACTVLTSGLKEFRGLPP